MNKDINDERYVALFYEIKTTYQWWGIDLTSMLDNIEKTDNDAYKAFYMAYKQDNYSYILTNNKSRKLFIDRLIKMIPKFDSSYVTINSIALKKDYECISWEDNFRQNTWDYILAIILLSQEFLFKNLNKDKEVNYYTNDKYKILSGYNDKMSCTIIGDKAKNIEAKFIVPNGCIIDYNAYIEKPKILIKK